MKLSTTPQVFDELEGLVMIGMWGKTVSEVAELLMRQKLIEVLSSDLVQSRGRKGPRRSGRVD